MSALPTRRSTRQRNSSSSETIRGLPITAFRRPWTQHYIDIGHCRLTKCTQRIQNASDADLSHLSISFLAMAIKASTAYGPKWRQEQALMEYTRAVIARGISPNDRDERLGSAVSMAAYFGYSNLLKLLLEAGCPVMDDGEPHALQAAVKNTQHECMRLLLEARPEELKAQLHKETLASWPARKPTTMKVAIHAGDAQAVRLLRPFHARVLILFKSHKAKWTRVVQQLHPNTNVHQWSKELHWSFPGADRRMLNWLWHALQQQNNTSNSLPMDLWLKVFGFMGRGWWSLSTVGDQNGFQDMPPSMLH